MVKIMTFPLVSPLIAGVAYGNGLMVDRQVGQYQVSIHIVDGPRVGPNTVEAEVNDLQGNPVMDVRLWVDHRIGRYHDDLQVGGYVRADTSRQGNLYVATVNFPPKVCMRLKVRINRHGGTGTANVNLCVP